jgi:hypothetical protein
MSKTRKSVGKLATDDQFYLSTPSINKMLKDSGVQGRKIADISAICIVALLLEAGFSSRKPEFSELLVDFGFVVDKVVLRQVFLLLLLFPDVIVTPTVPHIPSFKYHRRNKNFTTEPIAAYPNLTH